MVSAVIAHVAKRCAVNTRKELATARRVALSGARLQIARPDVVGDDVRSQQIAMSVSIKRREQRR